MGHIVYSEFSDHRLAGGPVRIYAAGAAHAPAVLLLHGAMLDWAELSWMHLAPVLAQTHRVYALDFPRHGARRPWGDTLVDQALLERIVHEALNVLAVGKVHLVGLSMGAGVAMGYALHHPERVRRAVLAAPAGIGAKRKAQLLTWAFTRIAPVQRWNARYLAKKPELIRDTLRKGLSQGEATPAFEAIVQACQQEAERQARHGEKALDDWQIEAFEPFSMQLDFLPELPDMRVPTLWLRGSDDPMVYADDVAEAVRRTPGAQFIGIERARHLLPLDQPEAFNRAVQAFLVD